MSERNPDGMYPYRPPNGTEGAMFEARFCERCKRDEKYGETEDGADGCKILTAVYRYDYDDPKYPKEWISDDAVGLVNPRCTAFEEAEK